MLAQPLSLRQARRLWHDFYNDLLSRSQRKQFKRVFKTGPLAGVEQVGWRKVKPFAASVKDTGSLLIHRAVNALKKVTNLNLFSEAELGELAEGVTIEVNCVELGKKRSLDPRTIYNHICELIQSGLIKLKIFRGWNRNLQLVIDSKYVLKMVQNDGKDGLNNAAEAQNTPVSEAHISTKLPPIEGFLITTLTSTSDGGKVENDDVQASEISAPATSASAAGDEATPEMGIKRALGGRGGLFSKKKPVETVSAEAAAEAKKTALLSTYSAELFHKSMKFLYPQSQGWRFTPEEIQRAYDSIAAGVYRNLDASLSLEQWAEYHQGALRRVNMAAKYFNTHTNYQIALPYALYTNDKGYFDADNPLGFIRTEAWYDENVKQNYWRRINDALKRAMKEFDLFKRLKRGAPVSGNIPLRLREQVAASDAVGLLNWHVAAVKQAGGQPALRRLQNMIEQARYA